MASPDISASGAHINLFDFKAERELKTQLALSSRSTQLHQIKLDQIRSLTPPGTWTTGKGQSIQVALKKLKSKGGDEEDEAKLLKHCGEHVNVFQVYGVFIGLLRMG